MNGWFNAWVFTCLRQREELNLDFEIWSRNLGCVLLHHVRSGYQYSLCGVQIPCNGMLQMFWDVTCICYRCPGNACEVEFLRVVLTNLLFLSEFRGELDYNLLNNAPIKILWTIPRHQSFTDLYKQDQGSVYDQDGPWKGHLLRSRFWI